MSADNRDFAVTYTPGYRWWSASCGECGEHIEHKSFAIAFGFVFRHKRCDGSQP